MTIGRSSFFVCGLFSVLNTQREGGKLFVEEKKPKKKAKKKPAKKRNATKKTVVSDASSTVNGRSNEPTDKNAWERRTNETRPAWEAFQTYLKMPDRTVIKVAQELGKSRALISRWALIHDWKERALAFDGQVINEAAEEVKENLVDEFTEIYNGFIESARALKAKADEAMKNIKVADMSPRDVIGFLKTATDLMGAVNDKYGEKPEEQAVDDNDVQIYLPDNGRMNE